MKPIKYGIFCVLFGIVSNNVLGGDTPPAIDMEDVARRNGITMGIESLIPRVYYPSPPIELDSLKYYSPDTYCHLEPDIKSLSYDQMKNVMKFCFAQHEKWVRLSI